jgi:GT2 family glycosyltransferase
MDKVFAIVVTYNGEFWISKCLDSLQNSSIPVHIIVVDNKSTDKTIEIIENEFPSVQLIKSEKNLGFGQGNNIGLRIALEENADYVFLLNQDAWIEKGTIATLIEVHRKNEDFGILSPFHLNYDGNLVEYYFSTIINPQSCPNLLNDIYFKRLNHVYVIEFIHAAAWLIYKSSEIF